MKLLESINSIDYNLDIDEDLNYDGLKLFVAKKFIDFCCLELKLDGGFSCKIVSDREKHKIKTTAYYDHSNNLVIVYGKNRMLGDVLRSVAHELTHRNQFMNDRITYPVQDVGGEIEDEANAKAGAIIKSFIKDNAFGAILMEKDINKGKYLL
jgi:hypothetical protein